MGIGAGVTSRAAPVSEPSFAGRISWSRKAVGAEKLYHELGDFFRCVEQRPVPTSADGDHLGLRQRAHDG